MPVHLGVSRQSSGMALQKVLLHGNKVASLSLWLPLDQLSLLHQLFTFSGPSVERLHIYHEQEGLESTRILARLVLPS